jgi:antitoxin HicB
LINPPLSLDEWAGEIVVALHYSLWVILEPQEEGGFTVLAPTLPEVVTEGDTEQEALANAKEAIGAILSYRRAHGISIAFAGMT